MLTSPRLQLKYRVSHNEECKVNQLRGKRIKNFIDLWCLVATRDIRFCVSSTNFQKNYIGWPKQPPTERVSDISKMLDF